MSLDPFVRRLAVLIVAGHVSMLASIALRLEVAHFDYYLYRIAGQALIDPSLPYTLVDPNSRPPMYAALIAPFLVHARTHPFGLAFRGPYLFNVACIGVLLVAAWQIYRLRFPGWPSLAALGTLCLSPLVVHYGPLPGHDIPSAALSTCIVALVVTRGPRALPLAGVLAAVLLAMRPNCGLVLPAFFVAEMVRRRRSGEGWFPSAPFVWWLGVVPLVGMGAVSVALYARALGSWSEGVRWFLDFFQHVSPNPHKGTDPWYELLVTVPLAGSLPVSLLALVGLAHELKSGTRLLPVAVVAAVLFLFQAFGYPRHELRYLLPMWFAVPYLAVSGIEWLQLRIGKSWITPTLATVAIAATAWGGLRQWWSFTDPVFLQPITRDIAAYVRSHAEGRKVYVNGTVAPIYPSDPVLHPFDEYWNVYHLGVPQIFGLASVDVGSLSESTDYLRNPALTIQLGRQSALVVDVLGYFTTSKNLPERMPPIPVRLFDVFDMDVTADGSTLTDGRVSVRMDPAGQFHWGDVPFTGVIVPDKDLQRAMGIAEGRAVAGADVVLTPGAKVELVLIRSWWFGPILEGGG